MIELKGLDKLNRELAKVGKNLDDVGVAIPESVRRRLIVGANDIRNTIIESMAREKKTGRFYKRKSGAVHRASAPGQPPAVFSGELLRSIMFDVRNLEVEVGAEAGAPYAELLEEGTSKMEARPFLIPAVDKHIDAIINAVGKDASKEIEVALGSGGVK